MMNNRNKGGFFISGEYHTNGGVPMRVVESGQHVEIEKDEALVPKEAMEDTKIKKRTGTNLEILHQINKDVGAKGMKEDVSEIHVGDAVVCRKAIYDNSKRTIIGTNKQAVSAINVGGGCKVIEKGGKTVEVDGKVIQYKKGGDVSVINARWDKKKKQIEELGNNIHRLRLNLTKSLNGDNEKDFLTALVISVMMKTGERIGNPNSADNGHFGTTGFRKKHIKINGSKVALDYVGKSGVEHKKIFTDKVLAKHLMKALKKSPSKFIFCTSDGFTIKADRVNKYLDSYGISAKSLRGFSANAWITEKLEKIEIPDTEKQRRTVFNKIAKSVAMRIGHGVPTLKKHYMMPELADNYIFDSEIVDVKEASVFATGGELGTESMEKRVTRRLNDENKISVKDLIEILGREPNYPNEYVGDLKLQKCFLINFYRLIK